MSGRRCFCSQRNSVHVATECGQGLGVGWSPDQHRRTGFYWSMSWYFAYCWSIYCTMRNVHEMEVHPDEDMHELWAFDKPGIPSPPDGWERLLVIRPVGSIKFADVYYVTPSGKRLRSMPEIDRFLSEHPEYGHGGLKPSQFSFLIPRPLDKDYCKKKNESLTCGDKSTTSEKAANSKSLPADSPSSKLGVMQPSLKVVSSKPPKLEKLKFRKKVVSGVSGGGEFQVLHSEERSCNTLAFQQAVMSPSMSQVAITPDTNGPNPVAGSKENEASTVGNCAESASLTTGIMSKDQHGMARQQAFDSRESESGNLTCC
ncbi:hypothetical protein GOP47_0022339 [Adiantum capillus-veneris]|uniref:MBD domain-containing protein n=1 Tax=Adiantum capillus-veneris TaxID=13818 RepID=A0A9D4U652_ADICA|nr:hypothetical protein GOP47_0022339 [Adiantum capillus-veneris]